MKRCLTSACVIVPLMAVAAGFSACAGKEARAIEKRWGIDLPGGLTELYHIDTWGWFGDGDAYTVFVAKGGVDVSQYEQSRKDAWFENFETVVAEFVRNLDIPGEYLPDFSTEYHVGNCAVDEGGSISLEGVTLLWQAENNYLFVLERRI